MTADFHMAFNVALALVFIFLLDQLAWLLVRLLPDPLKSPDPSTLEIRQTLSLGRQGFEPLHLRIGFATSLSSGREDSNMRISTKVTCRPALPNYVSGDDRPQRI